MVSPMDLIFIIFQLPFHSVFGKPAEYHAVGSNVTLQTMKHGGNKLTSIDWKHGENLAVSWDGQKLIAYRNFEERIFLNFTNGDLTLIGVNDSESGEYTVALNGKDCDTELNITVIHYVPVPTVTVNCSIEDDRMRLCLYTCAGDTSLSEPVSYEWSSLNPAPLSASNKTKVTMESLTGPPDQWFCTMKNPVSKATATTTTPSTALPSPSAECIGYVVSIVILEVLSLAFIGVHRLRTGVWIWKKEVWEKRKGL